MPNQTRSIPEIELLNSEGPILKAYKFHADSADETFVIYDEWKNKATQLNKEELLEFISGKRTISDSHERVWNYTKQHEGMKPSEEKLKAFIG